MGTQCNLGSSAVSRKCLFFYQTKDTETLINLQGIKWAGLPTDMVILRLILYSISAA